MATKKRKDQGSDRPNRKKAPEDQVEQPRTGESVEGGRTRRQGRVSLPPTPIVAIGSSAGGLEALQEFFSHVPADSGIAFVVVTHLRPGRDSMLPELLGAVTRMEVVHTGDSTQIEPNKIIVARDSLLSVSNGVLRPIKTDNKPESTYHPIDHFFRSLADDVGEHAIGIILSRTGDLPGRKSWFLKSRTRNSAARSRKWRRRLTSTGTFMTAPRSATLRWTSTEKSFRPTRRRRGSALGTSNNSKAGAWRGSLFAKIATSCGC